MISAARQLDVCRYTSIQHRHHMAGLGRAKLYLSAFCSAILLLYAERMHCTSTFRFYVLNASLYFSLTVLADRTDARSMMGSWLCLSVCLLSVVCDPVHCGI